MSNEKDVRSEITSDQLHNKNCFNYLRTLKWPARLLKELPPGLAPLAEVCQAPEKYDPNFAYGDLYKRFFDYIDDKSVIDDLYHKTLPKMKEGIERDIAKARLDVQEQIAPTYNKHHSSTQFVMRQYQRKLKEDIGRLEKEQNIEEQLDDLFVSIYANNNKILEDTYKLIEGVALKHGPSAKELKSSIRVMTKDSEEVINRESLTPFQAESTRARVQSVFSATYKPQHTTSLATERHYEWNKGHSVRELRFGTQGQRVDDQAQVSPLFTQFLKVQAKRKPNEITHIYINNLGRDRSDFEGKKEQALTRALEGLEQTQPNVAVITLPADKCLMNHHHYLHTEPKYSSSAIRNEFLQIASQDPACKIDIKDFYISQRVRELLFKNKDGIYTVDAEKEKLSALIDKSFKALNIAPNTELSPAHMQAVWFHFIKSELTNHIVDTLAAKNPDLSINFSCKDAIDRGGVSSAYYNLINSFERSPSPMSREEFERALHAAPTMVKGRGMNDHLKILWNCVDLYVNANYESLQKDPSKTWLVEWRDRNCPKARVQEILEARLPQLIHELVGAKEHTTDKTKLALIDKGITTLAKIQEQVQLKVSGKRLLLESAILIPSAVLNPTEKDLQRIDTLSDKLSVNPVLNVVGGLLKAFVGAIKYVVVKGDNKDTLNSGLATMQSGLEIDSRRELQAQMKKLIRAEPEATPEVSLDKEDTITAQTRTSNAVSH